MRAQDTFHTDTSLGSRIRGAIRAFASPKAPMGELTKADPYTMFGKSTPYNPSELISTRGYYTLDKMRVDDQVKAALAFKKNSVSASGWRIAAPEGKPDDWEPRVEIENQFNQLDGGILRVLKEVMSALDYGFSVSEKVWEQSDGGKVKLKKVATRKPHDLYMDTNPEGDLISVSQGQIVLPLPKLVIYSYDYEFSNHYGRSDLEASYRAWWTKDNAYRWMAMLLEKLGIPPIFAMYNSSVYTPESQTKLFEVLQSMQASTVAAIPRPEPGDLELWSPELAGQVATVFKPVLEMLNQDIARALLMPGLLGMTSDAAQGSMARSRVHFDVFMLVLGAIRLEVQEVVNKQIVDDILLYNFPPMEEDEKPYFEWMPITDEARLDLLDGWTKLIAGKIVQPQDSDEAHLREVYRFPEMDEADVAARAERRQAMAPDLTPTEDEEELDEEGNPKPKDQAPGDGDEGEQDKAGDKGAGPIKTNAALDRNTKHAKLTPPLTAKQFAALLEKLAP